MLHKVYDIELPYEELGLKTPDKKATITTYIKEMYPDYQDPFNRPLVIICPGGGYDHHSPREGESMAIKMLDLGYNAVVLRYSLAPYVYPTHYEENGTVSGYRVLECDDNGNHVSDTQYDSDWNVTSYTTDYQYDSDGNLLQCTEYNGDGSVSKKMVYYQKNEGDVLWRVRWYDADGNVTYDSGAQD